MNKTSANLNVFSNFHFLYFLYIFIILYIYYSSLSVEHVLKLANLLGGLVRSFHEVES